MLHGTFAAGFCALTSVASACFPVALSLMWQLHLTKHRDSDAEAVIAAVPIFVLAAKAGKFTAALRQATELVCASCACLVL